MGLENQGIGASVDFMRPKGTPREIDFSVDEGTWLSVDMSPDGKWIVFDLLGHIYRLPASGGEALCLTQGSGIALNFHPAISPDGAQIAFISDRSEQDNVWVMNADGSEPRVLYLDVETRFTDPDWHPDGNSVVAVRIFPSPGRGWHRRNMTLARISVNEGQLTEMRRDQLAHFTAPSYSSDGQQLVFEVAYSTWRGNGLLKAGHRIHSQHLASGEVQDIRFDEPVAPTDEYLAALSNTHYAADVEGDKPAALNPELSPDGRYLAFAIERPEAIMHYRGHEFRGLTGIMLRDLQTGEERLVVEEASHDLTRLNAQYSYRPFPGFSWAPDSQSLVIAYGGKIHRVDIHSGSDQIIPFSAQVHRSISEQVRSEVTIEDKVFHSKFLQWPVSSPTRDQLVFVAAGKLWTTNLAGETPRALTEPMTEHVQLTPDFSPDGEQVIFATWSDTQGGHVWQVPASGGTPEKLTAEAAQYLYPAFSADGSTLLVTRGPQRLWPAFTSPAPALDRETEGEQASGPQWNIALLDTRSGTTKNLVPLAQPRRATFINNDRVASYGQEDITATFDLRSPYPSETALAQWVQVTSHDLDGSHSRVHASLPPRLDFFGGSNSPVLSPDGQWLAFESGRAVFVAPLNAASEEVIRLETDPNIDVPGRIRVGDQGGNFPHWRDARTVEFVSGNIYVNYNVDSGETKRLSIDLEIPRDVPNGAIAFTGAKIITLDGDRIIDEGDLVIDGSRIACVGACELGKASRVIDASGKIIIPGLVDLHAHHSVIPGGIIGQHQPALALDLAHGVTTIIDPATVSSSAFPLAEMIEAGVLLGPRTFSSGEFVITQAYAWGDNLAITNPENAVFNADARALWGAIELKNYRLASRQHHQYLIEAARRHPITVTAEGGPLFADVGYAMDGQPGWEHLIGPLRLYRDATQFFGAAGIHYSPTVIVAGHVNGAKDYFRQHQGLLEDEKYNRFMPRQNLEAQHANLPDWPKREFSFPLVAEGMADIVRAGGYGALGEHGEQVGIGTHWELWAYAEALTPLEALWVGSYGGAHYVGLDRELGSIEVGKLADLIVLNSDPLEDIRNSTDIELVVKAGNVYDPQTLDRIWPDSRPFGAAPWWNSSTDSNP